MTFSMPAPSNTHVDHRRRWVFLGIISLGLFMVAADNSILYTALPTLEAQLHTTELEGLWIINAYPLILSGLLLGTGTLGDTIGHRRMFEIGLILFGCASLVAAFSPNPEILIAARGLLGVGAATMMPATLALLRDTFTQPRERNIAIGIWGSVSTLGAALGPVLGGLLLQHFWWGSVFLINVPIVVVAVIATAFHAPANRPQPNRRWDFLSSLWAMATMMGIVTIIKQLAHSPINGPVVAGAAVLSVCGGALFALRQRRITHPLLTRDVFYNPMFTAGVVGAAMAMFVLSGVELTTAQRFQLSAGFTPFESGLLTATAALAAFPTSILGGAIVHRVGFRSLISGGFLVVTGGVLTGAWGLHHNSQPMMIVGLILVGAGAGLTMSVTSTAVIGSAPAQRSGMASAVESVSYELGSLLSVTILGSLFGWFYTRYAPADVADSFVDVPNDPALIDAAHSALDFSYLSVLLIAAGCAAAAAVITAWLLSGNPKETQYARE